MKNITHHKLLVAGITVVGQSPKPCTVPPRRKVWKLRYPTICKDYGTFVNYKYTEIFSNDKPVCANDAWSKVKTCLLKGADQVYGWTCGGRVQHAELDGGIMMWINTSKKAEIKELVLRRTI